MALDLRRRPERKLAPPPDMAPAPESRLPCPDPEGPEQYLSDYAEALRLTLLTDTRKRWAARALQARTETAHKYACDRVKALRSTLRLRMEGCGRTWLPIRCDGGRRLELARPCRQWWVCPRCRGRRAASLRTRIVDGLTSAMAKATAGGCRVGVRLLTLTAEHSRDLDATREAIAQGWRAFYKAMREWLGAVPYVGVWEVTPGRDGLGHPHLHVAVIWPRFVPYGRVHTLWRRACPESKRISIVDDYQARRNGAKRASIGAEGAANYLAKYMSKGVEVAGFNDDLRGRVLASFYNRHLVLTSRRFWQEKPCPCCGGRWRRVTAWVSVRLDHGSTVDRVAAPDERGSGRDPPRLL